MMMMMMIHAIIVKFSTSPTLVAQRAKPPLIGHSACWPDGLRALAGLGLNPGLKGGFHLN